MQDFGFMGKDRKKLKILFKWHEKPRFYVNLYNEYTSLKSKELEELPRFRVMSWQPSQLPWSASLCLFG